MMMIIAAKRSGQHGVNRRLDSLRLWREFVRLSTIDKMFDEELINLVYILTAI